MTEVLSTCTYNNTLELSVPVETVMDRDETPVYPYWSFFP
jgi:hypothetical protein